jgi:hypothetical protein
MNLFSFISSIFAPAAKLVDELHTSDEERLTLANKLAVIQNEMHSKILDYESKLLAAQSGIITAEANGQSWMQTFLALVVFDSFGWLANPLASEAWTLLQIGLGGYVTGRSLEKIADKVKK